MVRYELLNNVAHKDLRVVLRSGAEFGDEVGVVPAFPTEYAELQREYPLFLRKDPESGEYHSVALLGFENNENLFLQDGRWKPTFPNAKYIMHRAEMDRWNPAHPQYQFYPHNEFTWEDSILPVVEAGQAVAVDDGYTLDDTLTLLPAPGHTLAHCAIHLHSHDNRAVFSGDVMHVPLQVYYPLCGTSLDDDPQLGVRSRLHLLESCAESQTLLLPTHFIPENGCFITRRGDGFAVKWNDGAD